MLFLILNLETVALYHIKTSSLSSLKNIGIAKTSLLSYLNPFSFSKSFSILSGKSLRSSPSGGGGKLASLEFLYGAAWCAASWCFRMRLDSIRSRERK